MDREPGPGAGRAAAWAPAAAVYLAAAFLLGIAVYSADDYWYSTFMDGSLGEYLELLRYHYEAFNGRVLVHVAAQLILHCGNWLFALAGTALGLWMPLSACLSAGLERRLVPCCLLVFGAGVLVMPGGMLTRGYLWVSAFCNYVLPTAMNCGLILMLDRLTRGGRPSAPSALALALLSFLCGATTEQSGFVALCLALYFCVLCLARCRRSLPAALLAAAASLAGLLTIFLSPATQARFASEAGATSLTSLFESVARGLEGQARLLGSGRSTAVLLAALFVLSGLSLRREGRRRWMFFACLVPAAAALAAPFCPEGVLPALYAGVFVSMALVSAALILSRRRVQALLTLSALASVCVMLPTNTVGERILLPFYLYSLAAASIPAAELLGRMGRKPALGAMAACALAVLALRAPLFSGCWGNYQVESLNRRYAREAAGTGELYYCMDYDMDYTHDKAFTNGYCYVYWLESAGFDESKVSVYFYSSELPAVYAGGERLTSPALRGADGGWLLPLRGIVEALGGTVEVLDGGLTVQLDGTRWDISYPAWGEALLTGGDIPLSVELSTNYFQTCLAEAAFTEGLGLRVDVDGDVLTVSRTGR